MTVQANNASRLYGQPNPAFTASDSGFVLGQDPSVLGGTLTFSTTAAAGSPAGTYPITPAGLTSNNYAIAFQNGTLTVIPASTGVQQIRPVNSGGKVVGCILTFTDALDATARRASRTTRSSRRRRLEVRHAR